LTVEKGISSWKLKKVVVAIVTEGHQIKWTCAICLLFLLLICNVVVNAWLALVLLSGLRLLDNEQFAAIDSCLL